MIELARFPNATLARTLASILEHEDIRVEIRPQGDQYLLWLDSEDDYGRARELVEAFIADPNHARFRDALWREGKPHAGVIGGQPPLFSGRWLASMGPVTRIVLFVCVAVYLSPLAVGDSLYRALMFPNTLAGLAHQPWRLITPMLLHFSPLHIIFNMLWWIELGRIIEDFQSSRQLLIVTLITAVTSDLAQFLATGPRFGGLSGVVYGLLGYLWVYGEVNPAAGYRLRKAIVILMIGWLVLCWIGLPNIVANQAHLAGLMTGCILGAAVGFWHRQRFAG